MSVHESCASQLRDVFKTHVAWSSHVLKLPCLHLLLQKQLPTLLFGKIIGFQERVSWSMRSSQRRLSSSSFLQKLSIKGGMLYNRCMALDVRSMQYFQIVLQAEIRAKPSTRQDLRGLESLPLRPYALKRVWNALTLGKMMLDPCSCPNALVGQEVCWRWLVKTRMHITAGCSWLDFCTF